MRSVSGKALTTSGHLAFVLAILASVCCSPPAQTEAQSLDDAFRLIERHERPHFAENHRLPPLTHWRALSFELMEELARHWGYGMHLYATPTIAEQLADPHSEPARIVRFITSDPDRHRLTVRVAPATELRRGRIRLEDFPEGAFYRDGDDRLIDGEYRFSPLAPDEAIQLIADHVAEQVRSIRKRAPIAVIINGGEYGFEKPQRIPMNIAMRDPRVRKSWERYGRPWVEFMSDHKARHERIVREAVRAVAPEVLYIHYSEVGGGHPRRKMVEDWEHLDFLYRDGVSDLAGSRHYFQHGNSGFTGERDILSQLLNSRAQEIAAGAAHAYFWVSAGWSSRGSDRYADQELYEGFLKSAYASGSVGAIAGYFGNRPDKDPVEESLPQFLTLGRVHALFSHIDELLLISDLLPGPERHRWSNDLPAYEFPTGHEHKRVLVRRHRDRPVWLLSAWAADGERARVRVEVPELGVIHVEATPTGNVYVIEPDSDGHPVERLHELP